MVTLTENAVEHFTNSISARGYGIGVRITIEDAGCSGHTYVVNYVDNEDEVSETDCTHTTGDLLIVTDETSLKLLNGTEIGFIQDGVNTKFEFKNPNAKSECGCGESFFV